MMILKTAKLITKAANIDLILRQKVHLSGNSSYAAGFRLCLSKGVNQGR